jgi:hypothetical protein
VCVGAAVEVLGRVFAGGTFDALDVANMCANMQANLRMKKMEYQFDHGLKLIDAIDADRYQWIIF